MKTARAWCTSDWHLFHDKLIHSGERPADFQERLIRHHRHLIGPGDIVYNLGDVCFYQMPKLADILRSIPGTHILLMGNHDHKSAGWYQRQGFAFAADVIVRDGVAFSHKPLAELPHGARLNVHGHLHTHRDHDNRQPWHRLVAMELTDYKPVLLSELTKD